MFKKVVFSAVIVLIALSSSLQARAEQSPESVKELVEQASEMITRLGAETAFAVIDDPRGTLVDGELYVFVQKFSGEIVAHGANKGLIGKNLLEVKDPDGKPVTRSLIEVASTKGEGWVEYKWPNPASKKIENKATFVKKVGDVMVACGIYKN